MKAAPEAQRHLLDLQAIDTALQQLAHRRDKLPQISALAALGREIASVDDERIKAQVGVDDIDRDISRLERDIDQVRARAGKDQGRLDAGSGPARELEALQHELASLARRQSELEDSELELMEQREQAQAAVDAAVSRLAEARERQAALESERDTALAEIAADEARQSGARTPIEAELPGELVELYEKIRTASGGVGAALLRAGRCGGCRLDLSGGERARVKAAPSDEVVRCDECRRIMVRTEESGL
ncbi:MAG TPA: C4-type zinc ribbon domain-containing protein [Micromonosporaceae bacterium]|nr:C4-type zinc ribbon domain-containing protein [Micromonosporaceae bacterium]